VKYQNFRDKPEEEMSWAEWLASGFKPAYTLEEAVRDPKFYEASAWDDLTQQMAKIGKKLKKDSLTQKKLRKMLIACYEDLVPAGLLSPQAFF